MKIVQIVPALPPRWEGVGGYALALAVRLREQGVETIFAHDGGADIGFPVVPWSEAPTGLPTLLHYANYGYHPHGTPSALCPRASSRARGGSDHAVGDLLPRVRGHSPALAADVLDRQRRSLARHLAEAADAAVTTIPIYETLLKRLAPSLRLHRLAMPSPVGEPTEIPPSVARESIAVVFGGPGNGNPSTEHWKGLQSTSREPACVD